MDWSLVGVHPTGAVTPCPDWSRWLVLPWSASVPRSRFALSLLALGCLLQSGCLGLLRTILYPMEAAEAIGSDLAYNVASELAGGVDQAAIASDSLANVEQMIQDHPDAANMESLERLRDHLREESGVGRSDAADADGLRNAKDLPGSFEPTEKLYPAPIPVDEFDRRELDFVGDPMKKNIISWPGRPEQVSNDLLVEFPGRRVDQMRPQEERCFSARPRQSLFPAHLRDYPTLFFDGEATRSAPMNQHLMKDGRILKEEDRVGYKDPDKDLLPEKSPEQRH